MDHGYSACETIMKTGILLSKKRIKYHCTKLYRDHCWVIRFDGWSGYNELSHVQSQQKFCISIPKGLKV